LCADRDRLIREARESLAPYGRDYAIGAIRSLAVRNMLSVPLPDTGEGFYPILKVHTIALKELEDVFYDYVELNESEDRGDLIMSLVYEKVWE